MSPLWRLELSDADLSRIPATGGLLLLVSLPYGGRELPALLQRLSQRRGDWLFSAAASAETEASLGAGGAVLALVGPRLGAGRIGHPKALDDAQPWCAMARRCGAAVQALRLHGGKRRPWLSWLGLDKAGFRRRMLGANAQRFSLRLRASSSAPLSAGRVRAVGDDRVLGEMLTLRFWLLSRRGRSASAAPLQHGPLRRPRPIASAIPAALLEAEISALPASARLAEHGDLQCWVAAAPAIPHVLRELGRLREEAFRAAGEGSGQPLDLDRFDQHYQHLFLWHKGERCLAGAYRFAPVDQVLASHGLQGLYTHSLLRFKPGLLQRLDPCLELGRSFIAPRFQKSFGPLLLLWRGLGAWIAAHPRYRRLFGLVSMSAGFQPLSRELVASYAKQHLFRRDLAGLTRPRRPYGPAYAPSRLDPLTWRLGKDLDEISSWVSELEPDGKGLPVLFRQYAGLGAVFFGFNVDPGFGHALDGLICVDLAQSDPRMLARTMGAEAAEAFLRLHGAAARS